MQFASEPCDTELAEVMKMYSEGLSSFKLRGQHLLLPQSAESMGFDTSEFDVNDLATFLQSLDSSRRKLLREISTLGKLLLVMPATNAVSKRSFSALKRMKTYLRSNTGDSRLDHLMMLHVHKDRTDALTLVDVANDFVGEIENQTNPKQVLYCIVHNCSDLTCTKKNALTEGPKRWGLMWATRSPPDIFCMLRACCCSTRVM